MSGTAQLIAFGMSDIGRVRQVNQDSFLIRESRRLYLVADGMGGHQGGEVASSLTVEAIEAHLGDYLDEEEGFEGSIEDHPLLERFSSAVKYASREVFEKGQRDPELHGMGTTLTGMAVRDGYVFIGHVGDSRCYVIRDGRIEQLSDDHSLVEEMVRSGLLTPDQARMSHMKNVITRSVGVEEDVAVDLSVLPIKPEDVYVLCSDGLSNFISTEEINEIVNGSFLRDVPRILIQTANDRGGDDNITCVLLYATKAEEAEESEEEPQP